MNKTWDFLFIYEVKNRELENLCLLKTELERRGYSVKLLETWNLLHHPLFRKYHAKVLISFALYRNDLIQMCFNYVFPVDKIMNLQWEQVYSIADENSRGSLYDISGAAVHAVHVCWGEHSYRHLIEDCHVPTKNALLVGHISFDFLKPIFNGYYLPRNRLLEKYGIDNSKKICLFISSFSYVGLPDSLLKSETYQSTASSSENFNLLSIQSQTLLLTWIENVLPKHPELIFIYRPHPAEVGNSRLQDIAKRIPNFKIIRDESVKQWILICDQIFTWFSTSIAEAFVANKKVSLIRPVPIPEDMDVRFFVNASSINSEQKFDESLGNDTQSCIDPRLMDLYYRRSSSYTYKEICNRLEEMLKTDHYCFDFSSALPHAKKTNIFRRMGSFCFNKWINFLIRHKTIFKFSYRFLGKSNKYKTYVEQWDFTERMIKNNYSSPDEIKTIQGKIKKILERQTKENI